MKDTYYNQWMDAREDGNLEYAEACKQKFRELVMKELEAPFKIYIEKLKAYPPIYLN
jgi:hypothetical protein